MSYFYLIIYTIDDSLLLFLSYIMDDSMLVLSYNIDDNLLFLFYVIDDGILFILHYIWQPVIYYYFFELDFTPTELGPFPKLKGACTYTGLRKLILLNADCWVVYHPNQ